MKTSEPERRIYAPAEDTFVMIDALCQYRGDMILEIGVGSGAIASELVGRSRCFLGIDIDIWAVRQSKQTLTSEPCAEFICGDSASPFREGLFDLIVFNPPYLPSAEVKDATFDGGKSGVEVSKEWFYEATRCLKEGGRIVFLVSSLSDTDSLFEYVTNLGFEVRVLKRDRLFFEEISVIEASHD
jgi:release factor glutamine methyltransferase